MNMDRFFMPTAQLGFNGTDNVFVVAPDFVGKYLEFKPKVENVNFIYGKIIGLRFKMKT